MLRGELVKEGVIQRLGQIHSTGWIVLEHSGDQIKELPVLLILRRHEVPVEGLAIFAHISTSRGALVPVDQFAMVVVFSPGEIREQSTI